MAPFELRHAGSIAEAVELLAVEDAHAVAGGTALVLLMKQGLLRPARLVSLAGIAPMSGVEALPDGALRIGALATIREAERSAAVRAHCDALTDAFAAVATPRIRAQATVGGNLAHADPAQDPPPMLIALGTTAILEGARGERSLPLEHLFVDVFETRIARDEVLREVRVPPMPAGARAAYVKFLPRTEDDYATVSVAAMAALDAEGRCADVRVVIGACGSTPIRARAVEDALRGETPSEARLGEAAALARDAVDPIDDLRGSASYKRGMAAVWTERALRRVLAA